MKITFRRLLEIVCFVLMSFIICYAGAILLRGVPFTPPIEKICKSGHYEKSPHHIMCLNGNKNIFCNQDSEWETYYVCDDK